jgi:hypothetical protein
MAARDTNVRFTFYLKVGPDSEKRVLEARNAPFLAQSAVCLRVISGAIFTSLASTVGRRILPGPTQRDAHLTFAILLIGNESG